MSATEAPVKVTLQSNDNATIEVDKVVAERSLLIKNMLEDLGENSISQTIPIPNVSTLHPTCDADRNRSGDSSADHPPRLGHRAGSAQGP